MKSRSEFFDIASTSVVILAGGLATRLKPITENIPKSMITICGKPFLEYQLNLLKKNDLYDVILCVGYLHEQIEAHFGDGNKYGARLTYSHETERLLGTAGAIKNAERHFKSDFFIMYGDSYLPINFQDVYNYFKQKNVAACMVVYRNKSLYERSNVVFKDGFVRYYNKKELLPEMTYIDYGLTVLSKKVLERIPKDTIYDLADIQTELSVEGELCGYEVFNRFYEVGSFQGIKDFEQYISERGI